MNKILKLLITLFCLFIASCQNALENENQPDEEIEFLSAVDISRFPEIENYNLQFYDLSGIEKGFLDILKENGVNTIRLRLWVQPEGPHSGFHVVKEFSAKLKGMGFKIWLTLHYSDTWADPAHQKIPRSWLGLQFEGLKDSVYSYTYRVMEKINPEFIQIGNEINSGLLKPVGDINTNYMGFIKLLKSGVSAVREVNSNTKIILHYAGINGSDWLFEKVKELDYDIIGLSYYPIWHGKSLNDLKEKLELLSKNYNKKVVIAETSYPFTLSWYDWTNNIVGSEEQLILPAYPATFEGQRNYIHDLFKLVRNLQNGFGLCYWGAELVAWKGKEAKDASPWENQALFDFNNRAVPALNEFLIKDF